LAILDSVLGAGVRIVQLREKGKGKRELYELAKIFRDRTRAAGCLLIVNDHLDVAMAVDADGVHLGRSDLPVEAARRLAPEMIVGASSHSVAQALEAQAAGASYVNIGPIYPTGTKSTQIDALGPDIIADVRAAVSIPFSCMGGIKPDNLEPLLVAGARLVAVVTAVTAAPDVRAAASALRKAIVAKR
jgi:thiamine-phosphate pyrophosphorylase